MIITNDEFFPISKTGKIVGYIFIIIFIIWIFYAVGRNYLIDEYGIETKGQVIDEITGGSQLGAGFDYIYTVNGKQYYGSNLYNCNEPYSDSLICKVKYLPDYPSIAKAFYNGKFSGCNLP